MILFDICVLTFTRHCMIYMRKIIIWQKNVKINFGIAKKNTCITRLSQ